MPDDDFSQVPPITDKDMRWVTDPPLRLETWPMLAEDLANLTHAELIEYVLDLREDMASLRELVHALLAAFPKRRA